MTVPVSYLRTVCGSFHFDTICLDRIYASDFVKKSWIPDGEKEPSLCSHSISFGKIQRSLDFGNVRKGCKVYF